MIPILALLVGCALIVWLIQQDRKLRQLPSGGVWIACIWLGILCSRSPAQWLGAVGFSIQLSEHGNTVDSAVYLVLIVAALITLVRRRIAWTEFASNNKALVVMYVFLACTALWAADPGTTVKRVFKDSGSILAALILLTEPNPLQVIRAVFVRMAYVMFTLSVVFIKYFPNIGRVPNRSGDNLFGGVTTHKNTLGLMVFILGLFVVVDIANLLRRTDRGRLHLWIRYGLMAMGLWLLVTCNSKTALICLILGIVIFWSARYLAKLRRPQQLIALMVVLAALIYALQANFQVISNLMVAIGRDPTMTGRTLIWEEVFQVRQNSLLGYGFYSFWESPEGQTISEAYQGTLSTIHSGYLETLIDTGVVGFSLLLILLLSWCYRSMKRGIGGSPMGRLSFVIWCLAMIYNFSETSFFRLDPLWFTLLLMMIELPARQNSTAALDPETPGAKPIFEGPEPRDDSPGRTPSEMYWTRSGGGSQFGNWSATHLLYRGTGFGLYHWQAIPAQ